jgi:hypothetical protein
MGMPPRPCLTHSHAQFSPAGHNFVDQVFKSAGASFLSIYLSLPKQTTATEQSTYRASTSSCELAGTILDRLSTPQGRHLATAAVTAFASAVTPIVMASIGSNTQHASPTVSATEQHEAHRHPQVVDVVLEWLTHPASKEQAEELLSSIASKTAAAAVTAALQQSSTDASAGSQHKHHHHHVDGHHCNKDINLQHSAADKVYMCECLRKVCHVGVRLGRVCIRGCMLVCVRMYV